MKGEKSEEFSNVRLEFSNILIDKIESEKDKYVEQ